MAPTFVAPGVAPSGASRVLRLRRMDREGQDEATVATLRMAAGPPGTTPESRGQGLLQQDRSSIGILTIKQAVDRI